LFTLYTNINISKENANGINDSIWISDRVVTGRGVIVGPLDRPPSVVKTLQYEQD